MDLVNFWEDAFARIECEPIYIRLICVDGKIIAR